MAFHRDHRVLPSTVAALVAAFVFAVPACERQGRAGPNDSEANSQDEGASRFLDSQGERCERDPDCSGYLRCLDGTCRIPPAVSGDQEASTPTVRFQSEDGSSTLATFYVELATNAAQRRRGLMFRPKMRPAWGMLFVYPEEAERAFWMKNTYIPLDMVFMDATGRVVHVVHRAEPRTTTQRPSKEPARFVLELNGGTASAEGIEAGTSMTVENIPPKYAPTK